MASQAANADLELNPPPRGQTSCIGVNASEQECGGSLGLVAGGSSSGPSGPCSCGEELDQEPRPPDVSCTSAGLLRPGSTLGPPVNKTDVNLRNRRSQVRILSGALPRIGLLPANMRKRGRDIRTSSTRETPGMASHACRDHRATIARSRARQPFFSAQGPRTMAQNGEISVLSSSTEETGSPVAAAPALVPGRSA
jgi:hypothetical protein